MRPEPNALIAPFRLRVVGYPYDQHANSGCYVCWFRGSELAVIASDGMGWDHVSVSTPTRCPTWDEMCYIKSLFFRDDEWVVQYHPSKSDYVNFHAYCLHLWRPQHGVLLTPPSILVGPKSTRKKR